MTAQSRCEKTVQMLLLAVLATLSLPHAEGVCEYPTKWRSYWWINYEKDVRYWRKHIQLFNTSWAKDMNIDYKDLPQECTACTEERFCTDMMGVMGSFHYHVEQTASQQIAQQGGYCALGWVNQDASLMVYAMAPLGELDSVTNAAMCAEKNNEALKQVSFPKLQVLVKYPFQSSACPFPHGTYQASVKQSHSHTTSCVDDQNSYVNVEGSRISFRLCVPGSTYVFPFHRVVKCMGEISPSAVGSSESNGNVLILSHEDHDLDEKEGIHQFYVVRYIASVNGTIKMSLQGIANPAALLQVDPKKRYDTSGHTLNNQGSTHYTFQHAITMQLYVSPKRAESKTSRKDVGSAYYDPQGSVYDPPYLTKSDDRYTKQFTRASLTIAKIATVTMAVVAVVALVIMAMACAGCNRVDPAPKVSNVPRLTLTTADRGPGDPDEIPITEFD